MPISLLALQGRPTHRSSRRAAGDAAGRHRCRRGGGQARSSQRCGQRQHGEKKVGDKRGCIAVPLVAASRGTARTPPRMKQLSPPLPTLLRSSLLCSCLPRCSPRSLPAPASQQDGGPGSGAAPGGVDLSAVGGARKGAAARVDLPRESVWTARRAGGLRPGAAAGGLNVVAERGGRPAPSALPLSLCRSATCGASSPRTTTSPWTCATWIVSPGEGRPAAPSTARLRQPCCPPRRAPTSAILLHCLVADMEIRMLLPKDPESERLVQWVEGGAHPAATARRVCVHLAGCCPPTSS